MINEDVIVAVLTTRLEPWTAEVRGVCKTTEQIPLITAQD